MNNFTPEMDKNLKTWAEQRDTILLEISKLNIEKERITKDNKNLASSNTDIQNQVSQVEGRLIELNKNDGEFKKLISKEVSALIVQKSNLEIEIFNQNKELSKLKETKEEINRDILLAITVNDDVFQRTGILKEIVEHVTKISSENIVEINNLTFSLKDIFSKILGLSTENIKAHTRILNEIPTLFVELKRKSLERPIIINKKKNI